MHSVRQKQLLQHLCAPTDVRALLCRVYDCAHNDIILRRHKTVDVKARDEQHKARNLMKATQLLLLLLLSWLDSHQPLIYISANLLWRAPRARLACVTDDARARERGNDY